MAVSTDISILVVDDYKTMVRIVRNLLEQLGFKNVDEASDGSTAWSMLNNKTYDLVISDWNMQPMTGLDLLKKVRENPRSSNLPFIMVTAEAKAENVAAARAAGVNSYIIKPFTVAVLKQKMQSVLGAF